MSSVSMSGYLVSKISEHSEELEVSLDDDSEPGRYSSSSKLSVSEEFPGDDTDSASSSGRDAQGEVTPPTEHT